VILSVEYARISVQDGYIYSARLRVCATFPLMAKNMPSLSMRLNIWNRFCTKGPASLAKVVQRLLACHATSCATERSLWGSVYSGSRHALGKKLITICANSRQAREHDFAVSLAVAEGDIEL
jgi:hypothetical protein